MAKYDQGGGCACGLYKECLCKESRNNVDLKVSIEALERDYFNSKTEYDRWKTFQRSLDWIRTQNELIEFLREKSS
jgi:hypothetical protein